MSPRKTLLLLTVLLGLGGYIYFIELDRQQAEEDAKTLLEFDPEAVTQVALIYPERELRLAKDDEGWRITQPIEARADSPAVDNLVKAVDEAEVSRTLDEPQPDLSLYGLDAPTVTVRLSLGDDELPHITIGKDTPVGYSVYVQRAGEDSILLTPQAFRLGMTKETTELRDKTVLAFDKEQVSQIEVRRPAAAEPAVILRKTGDGWRLDPDLTADEATVSTFLSSLSGMRAQDFIEQPGPELKAFGLDPPRLSVGLTVAEDSPPLRLLVGSEKSNDRGTTQRHVKREDAQTLYLVGDWTFADLNKTTNDFRDKTVARFAKEAVVRLEVLRQDGDGFLLTRAEDAQWQIDATHAGTLNENALDQFVTDVHELRGFAIAADNPADTGGYGLSEPLLTIRAYDQAEERLAGLLLGQTAGDDTTRTFAMAEDGQTVFELRDYVFERLNRKPADFRETPAEAADDEATDPETNLEEEQL